MFDIHRHYFLFGSFFKNELINALKFKSSVAPRQLLRNKVVNHLQFTRQYENASRIVSILLNESLEREWFCPPLFFSSKKNIDITHKSASHNESWLFWWIFHCVETAVDKTKAPLSGKRALPFYTSRAIFEHDEQF